MKILGLGNEIVDVSCKVDDSFIKHFPALVMFILSSFLVLIQKKQNLISE